MKHQSYLDRALKAKDRRYARIFDKLGYNTAAMASEHGHEPVATTPSESNIDQLRQTYLDVIGKKPFNGWDAATLQAKIDEKRAAS